MEGGKDQVSWPVDPVPGMSQKGAADVSPGHHLLSCGARFEPTTFSYTSSRKTKLARDCPELIKKEAL